jgi:hypothetical protein
VIILASNRALQKKAPFHDDGKNNFADALILEPYGQIVKNGSGKGRCMFVSQNVTHFSATNADQRLPHPDFAEYFSPIRALVAMKRLALWGTPH